MKEAAWTGVIAGIATFLATEALAGDPFSVAFSGSVPVTVTSNALGSHDDLEFDRYLDPNFELKVSRALWEGTTAFVSVNADSSFYDRFDGQDGNLLAANVGFSQSIGNWYATLKYRELFSFDSDWNEQANYHDIALSLGRDFPVTDTVGISLSAVGIRRFVVDASDRTLLELFAGPYWTVGKWYLSATGSAIYTIYDEGAPAPRNLYVSGELSATYNVNDHISASLILSASHQFSNIVGWDYTEWAAGPSLDFNFAY